MEAVQTLNFVVVGPVRGGTSIVQSAISNRKGAVCHADLFHPEVQMRQDCHEAYFGACPDKDKLQDWYVEGGVLSPYQYLASRIFDNPMAAERCIGVRIHYSMIQALQLCDTFEQKTREGDFCVIHVRRNPVACYVSLKQAELSGIWLLSRNDERRVSRPSRISVDVNDLTAFVREQLAIERRIREACDDSLFLDYADLAYRTQETLRTVFEFLELPDEDTPPCPTTRRLPNRDMLERISNLDALRRTAPSEVRVLLTDEVLT